MTYAATLTREALEDLLRLEDFPIKSALRHGDLDLPSRANQMGLNPAGWFLGLN